MDVFDLVAKISLDTSKYESSLASAEAKGKGFAASLGSGLSKAAKVGTVALAGVSTAAALVTGKVVKSAQAVADYGDEVDKTSQKLGLSAEAYQKWNYVLNLSGTEMSSMTTGLKTLTNKLDDAKNGSEDAQAMFAKLGLSMDDVNNMSREEVFEATIKGFQGMADSTERAALANDLFGRSGQNLTPLFNQSAEKTQEQIELAERYGMIMPDSAVKASAAFKDSMTTMQMTMTGLRNRIMGDFLPSLTKVTDGIAKIFAGEDGGEDIAQGLEEFVMKLTDKIPRVVQILTDVLPKIVAELAPLLIQMGILLVAELVKALPQILYGLATTLPQALYDVFGQTVEELWEDMKDVGRRIIEGIGEGIKNATDWLKETIREWVGNVTDFIKGLFGIHSPSAVMRDQIGKFLPEGIAVGIEANADAVYSEMDAMREKVAEPFDVSVIGADGIHSSQSMQMDDRGIVTAINEVKDYIDKLQVVLSTGETVGALTPYIDSALGRTQAIKAMGG